MALQVWLPGTNGTLLNQGLYKLPNPSYNSMSEFTLGKLGKAIKGNAMYHLSSDIFGDKWSVACWIKFISGYSQYNNIILCLNTSGSEDSKFYLSIVNNTYLNIGRGSSGGVTYTLSGGFIIDTWYHVAATCDGTKTLLYLNGNLVNSGNVGSVKSALNLGIGCRSTNDAGTNITGFSWPMNDIRIYDHCLSPKEVKEISKGLLLHYKLDDIYSESTTNLATYSTIYSNVTYGSPFSISGWGGDTGTCTCYKTGGYNDGPYKVYHKTSTGSGGIYWKSANDIHIVAGKTYTFSVYIKASREYTDSNYSFNINRGSDNAYITYNQAVHFTTEWKRIEKTFTATSGQAGDYGEMSIIYNDDVSDYYVYYSCFQIEEKDHATPFVIGTRNNKTIYDCSGYLNNGIITGNLQINTDSPKYNYSTLFSGQGLVSTTASGQYILTISLWAKDNGSIPSDGLMFKDHLGDMALGIQSNILYSGKSGGQGAGYISISNINYTVNTWHHWVMVNRNNTYYVYMDGQQVLSGTNGCWSAGTITNALHIGGRSGSSAWPGSLSDFRAYATALSVDDIKELYHTAGSIDNQGNLLVYEFNEVNNNIVFGANYGIISKQWLEGLSSYTQSNCSCTLTDTGYRIYRGPNLTVANNGNTMWGGFVLDNNNNRFGLTKGHTYIIEFFVKGQSSNNVSDIYWANLVGWGGGGLSPSPSNISMNNPVESNFQSTEWKYFYYKFTINDDVYKVCTSSYSSFVQGNTYLSYKGFKFGFGYTSTGSLGTDLYIKNLSMYDITTNTNININKRGIMNANKFIEEGNITRYFYNKTIESTQFIEI